MNLPVLIFLVSDISFERIKKISFLPKETTLNDPTNLSRDSLLN